MGVAIFVSLVVLAVATTYGVIDILRQINKIK